MNLSTLSVKRPVTTIMCVLVALSFGLMSMMNLSMDMMPNMNIPIVLIMTTYEGASSEEIKTLVTKPMEEAVATVSGLDTLQSTSSAGNSMVMARFDYSVDVDIAAQDVRERVDMYKSTLPKDAKDPMILKIDVNSMIGNIIISASSDSKNINELKSTIDDLIVPRLERQKGVASISTVGGNKKIIEISLDQEKMRAYGISESTVTGTLVSENINTPLGSVYKGDKNLTLRIKGEYRDVNDIQDVLIPAKGGSSVFLSDIANVKETYEENKAFSYTDGMESITMTVSKTSTANTVDVSKAVFGELEKIKEEMPEITFVTVSDPAEYIQLALKSVVDSLWQGGLFAIIVLFIFLREIRSTLVVAVSMPVSIVTTFAVMRLMNVNFNMMSLGGLTLGIGMLVDNSIVVMESIYKKLEEGRDRIRAAMEGGTEVVNSVLASTLTTVAVFLPITMVEGQVSELFNDMCLTIVFSLLSSLVVSVTFVPMACSLLLTPEMVNGEKKSRTIIGRLLDILGKGLELLEKFYDKLINKALNMKKLTVAVAILFVFLTGIVVKDMNAEFMASTDEGQISIDVSLPKGSTIERTEKIAWKVLNAVEGDPDITHMSMSAGSSGNGMSALSGGGGKDKCSIEISLRKKADGRTRTTDEIAGEMRRKLTSIPGAKIEVSSAGSSMGSYSSAGLEIDVFGDDAEAAKKVSEDFVDILSKADGLADVKSSIEESSPNATIRIDKRKANSLGITVSSISSILKTDISGSTPTKYKINGDEYDIKVSLEDGKVNYISDVEQLLIPTSGGGSVPLSEICEIIDEDVPVSISRENQKDKIAVTATLDGAALSEAQTYFEEAMKTYNMPGSVSWAYGGSAKHMAEAFSGLLIALVVAVLLVYMVMAAEFEAYSFPFIVMFSIPIAITGGLFGNFIWGQDISVTTFLGLIMLSGVVVNNAIVLIDYANLQVRERGKNYKEAMLIAGPVRLRPILMSTLTTVLGMLPMMLSQADGSESMRGLAVTVVFGLSFSTLVTLVLIPAIYVAFNERIDKGKKKKQARKEKRAAKKAAAAEA